MWAGPGGGLIWVLGNQSPPPPSPAPPNSGRGRGRCCLSGFFLPILAFQLLSFYFSLSNGDSSQTQPDFVLRLQTRGPESDCLVWNHNSTITPTLPWESYVRSPGFRLPILTPSLALTGLWSLRLGLPRFIHLDITPLPAANAPHPFSNARTLRASLTGVTSPPTTWRGGLVFTVAFSQGDTCRVPFSVLSHPLLYLQPPLQSWMIPNTSNWGSCLPGFPGPSLPTLRPHLPQDLPLL